MLKLYRLTPFIEEIEPGTVLNTRDHAPFTFTHIKSDPRTGNWIMGTDALGRGTGYRPHGLFNCMLREVKQTV